MMRDRQLPLPLEHRLSLSGEDFLVASCNREAVEWLDRWPDWPTRVLVVHGPPGCGKTHLSHIFLGRCRGMVVEHGALGLDQAIDVAVRSVTCIVDDADRAVAAGFEAPLLHLHNAIVECGGHLLLTAEAPPARWPIMLADLRSRLNAATPVGIGPPDDALIAGVLVKLFMDRGLRVADEVVLYAVPRMERSFAAARGLVADLDAAALARRCKITISLLREVLGKSGKAA
jgi:chromosomal replication initiation ATPase DnaA